MKRKRVFATLRVLGIVLEQLTEEIPEEVGLIVLHMFNANLFFMDHACIIDS